MPKTQSSALVMVSGTRRRRGEFLAEEPPESRSRCGTIESVSVRGDRIRVCVSRCAQSPLKKDSTTWFYVPERVIEFLVAVDRACAHFGGRCICVPIVDENGNDIGDLSFYTPDYPQIEWETVRSSGLEAAMTPQFADA